MDLRKLSYFIAVAEERHLRRAAERLHLSQPPLTRHIKALEEELGVVLFIRTPRGMLLTPSGETLLQDAYAVMGMLNSAAERARLSGMGLRGQLDVGIYGSSTFGAIPALLHTFKKSHPEVEINLLYAQTPSQVSALRQRRISIAFERLLPNEPDIEVGLLLREKLVIAVNSNHRLADFKHVSISDLKSEKIRIGSAPAEAATLIELCREEGFEPQFTIAKDVVLSTLLTAIGSEVSLVPQSMTNVAIPGIKYIPLNHKQFIGMNLYYFYMKDDKSPLLQEILKVIHTYKNQI